MRHGIKIKEKLKKVAPHQAKSIVKEHTKQVKSSKKKFKELGGKY